MLPTFQRYSSQTFSGKITQSVYLYDFPVFTRNLNVVATL